MKKDDKPTAKPENPTPRAKGIDQQKLAERLRENLRRRKQPMREDTHV